MINYKDYLKSNDWIIKRHKKLKNVSRCAICSSNDHLDIHHLNYKNLYDIDQSDLRVLCRECHYLCHKLFKEGKIKFVNDNHNSKFAILKNAVKKELGISKVNMFSKM